MKKHNVQLSFSCPYELAEALDVFLSRSGSHRGRSEFIREAIEAKLSRENRETVLASNLAADLRSAYWVKFHEDPSDDDVIAWISEGRNLPPGIGEPAPEEPASSASEPRPWGYIPPSE